MNTVHYVRSVKEARQIIEERLKAKEWRLQETGKDAIEEATFPALLIITPGWHARYDCAAGLPVFLKPTDITEVLEAQDLLEKGTSAKLENALPAATLPVSQEEARRNYIEERDAFLSTVGERVFAVRDPATGDRLEDPLPEKEYEVKVKIGVFKDYMGSQVFHVIEGEHVGTRYKDGWWCMIQPPREADGTMRAPYHVTDDMVVSYQYVRYHSDNIQSVHPA